MLKLEIISKKKNDFKIYLDEPHSCVFIKLEDHGLEVRKAPFACQKSRQPDLRSVGV